MNGSPSLRRNAALRPILAFTLAVALLVALLGLLRETRPVLAAERNYPGDTPCDGTLQACINGSNPGDIIHIAAGTYDLDSFEIPKSLTLIGAGPGQTILQAALNQRVISIHANIAEGVTLAGLTIRNGNVDGNGGGIYSGDNTPLTLNNVELYNNIATAAGDYHGGGMWVGGPLTVIDSVLHHNYAQNGDGGSIYVVGPVTISGTQIYSSGASSGAGIYAREEVILEDVEIRSNEAISDGGGLYTEGSVVFREATFADNVAGGRGGGAFASSHATLYGGTVEGNRAEYGGAFYFQTDTAVLGAQFAENQASLDGGALFVNGDVLLVFDSTFRRNLAERSAGAIWAEYGATISQTHFLTNTSGADAGALRVNANTSTVTGGSFVGNHAGPDASDGKEGGGAIFQAGGLLTLNGVVFERNSSFSNGGAIVTEDQLWIADSTFTGNKLLTSGAGGAIYVDEFSDSPKRLDITRSTFTANEARQGGGLSTSATSFITETVFLNNSATSSGGGIWATGYITVDNSQFLSNTASTRGGAMLAAGHSRVQATTFDRNRATFGGALWLGMLNGFATLNENYIDRANFTRNSATDEGGAIFINDTTVLTLTNSLLALNTADSRGGAIFSTSPNLRVINATIAANHAASGGGIRIANGNLYLANSIVWNNTINQIQNSGNVNILGPNIIQGGAFSGLNQAPQFVAAPNRETDSIGDIRLRQNSPAIDAGASGVLPAVLTFDLNGQPRRVDITAIPNTGTGLPPIDLGATEVNNQVPVAEANGPYTAFEGTPLALSANGSSSGDVGQEAEYAWDCTDNGSFEHTSDQPTGATCTYANEGNRTVRLRVTDADGFVAEDTADVTVQNVAPTFSGQATRTAAEGSETLFPLGNFADPGADSPWTVTVDWGDNSTDTTFHVNTPGSLGSRSHTYANNGSYNVALVVFDGTANGVTNFTVNVSNVAPTVTPPANQTAEAEVSKSFAVGSFTDPGTDAPWNVTIDWGDGSPDIVYNTNDTGSLGSWEHTYLEAGTFNVTVTVTDKDGGTDSASFMVTVESDDPDPGPGPGPDPDEQFLYLPSIATKEEE